MLHTRTSLALAAALAAVVAVPATALAVPACHATSTTPDPAAKRTDAPGRAEFTKALKAARQRSGIAALAAMEPPASSMLWVSDGTGSVRVTLSPDGTGTGSTPFNGRTDVVIGPAGDTMAYRSGGATLVRPLPPTSTT